MNKLNNKCPFCELNVPVKEKHYITLDDGRRVEIPKYLVEKVQSLIKAGATISIKED